MSLKIAKRKVKLAEQALAMLITGQDYTRPELFAGNDRAAKTASWQHRFLANLRAAGLVVREGTSYRYSTYHAVDEAAIKKLERMLHVGVRELFLADAHRELIAEATEEPAAGSDPVRDLAPEESPLKGHSDREILECCYQWITSATDRIARVEKKLDKLIEVWS